MNLFFVTFLVMLLAVAAMAIGVILGGRRIQGSCGGLNNIDGLENACGACAKPCARRRKAIEKAKNQPG